MFIFILYFFGSTAVLVEIVISPHRLRQANGD